METLKKFFRGATARFRFWRLEYFSRLSKKDFCTINSQKMPVVLVAGIYAGGRSLVPLKKFLEKNGWSVSLAPERKNFAPLSELAEKLARRIAKIPAQKVQLVVHSMGGLTALVALRDPKISRKVDRVIALGSPFGGSALGAFALLEKNQKYLVLGSPELKTLTANHKINSKFFALRAEFDEIVFPPEVSELPDARENSTIPVTSHAALILSKKSWRAVVRRLEK
jgi:pimeloyl-ACP methyl ester carboxylesterase